MKRKPMRADDFLKELNADPEYVRRRAKLDAGFDAQEEVLRVDEAPVMEDLRKAGFHVESVWHLFNTDKPWQSDAAIPDYSNAIPVLEKHLGGSYHPRNREGIARALTGEGGRGTLEKLHEVFRETTRAEVADLQIKVTIRAMLEGCREDYSPAEIEECTQANWDSYRFSLVNAICENTGKGDVEMAVDLIKGSCESMELKQAFASELRRKVKRWRGVDPGVMEFLESVME